MAIHINASLTYRPNRVSPLDVHCDASTTTADGHQHPFHSLAYFWNRGGVEEYYEHGTGRESKNRATGPKAAFLLETPNGGGAQTFTVKLTVYGVSGGRVVSAEWSEDITVEDQDEYYDGNTYLVSNSGSVPGAPAGYTQVAESAVEDIATLLTNNKRVLLHDDEVFTRDPTVIIATSLGTGWLLGRWPGTGAKPTIQLVDSHDTRATIPAKSNCVVDGLQFDPNGETARALGPAISGQSHILFARCEGSGMGAMCSVSTDILVNYVTFYECDLDDFNKGEYTTATFAGALFWRPQNGSVGLALLGVRLYNTDNQGGHCCRLQHVPGGAVVQGCTIRRAYPGVGGLGRKGPFLIHSPNSASQYVVVTGCDINTETSGGAAVSISPTSTSAVEVPYDIIVERCLIGNGEFDGTSFGINIQAARVSVRSNVFRHTQTLSGSFSVNIGASDGTSPPSDLVWVHGNTTLSDTPETATGINVVSGATNTDVRDNLMSASAGTAAVVGGTPTFETNNTSDDDAENDDPDDVFENGNGDYSDILDFKLKSGSPALGAGSIGATMAQVDILGHLVRRNTEKDLGAFQRRQRITVN